MHQFLAHGLHVTEQRTGVLIFAAMADRQVEVIADMGIHSRVDPDVWAQAVEALTRGLADARPAEGFETAIALTGAVLAEHFPPRARNPNETPDRLVEI
jgi:putative membrane protein